MEYERSDPPPFIPRTDALPDCVVFPETHRIHDGNVIGLRARRIESKTDGCRLSW